MTEWAEAGDYDLAVESVRMIQRRAHGLAPGEQQEFAKVINEVCRTLEDAHVVTISADQVLALPEQLDTQQIEERFAEPRLPFNPLYLSIPGGLLVRDSPDDEQGTHWVGALLAITYQETLGIVPFIKQRMIDSDPREYVVPFQFHSIDEDLQVTYNVTLANVVVEEHRDRSLRAAESCMQYAMEILYFLESANVYIGEQEVSRQVRRKHQRKGRRIADEVLVRQGGKRKRSKPNSDAEPIDYSHRFEVAGHYKHFGAETKLAAADPSKLVDVPGRGLCRRIWCPPFVKGDPSKPLIPKVRKVVGE